MHCGRNGPPEPEQKYLDAADVRCTVLGLPWPVAQFQLTAVKWAASFRGSQEREN
jgi:hypothetical protein